MFDHRENNESTPLSCGDESPIARFSPRKPLKQFGKKYTILKKKKKI